MPLTANDLTALRTLNHRSDLYASFLQPMTLWTVMVDGDHPRGSRYIAFKNGSGNHWGAVEPLQTALVYEMGFTPPATFTTDFIDPVRIRGVTSGDAGSTGILNLAPNNVEWTNNQLILISHDYRYDTMYPDIDPNTEEFYKDVDVPYPGSPEALAPPVVIAEFSARAQFIRNGKAVFFLDLNNSYPVAEGATLTNLDASIYPDTTATIAFDGLLGKWVITCIDLSQSYYWVKCSATDSNGTTQTAYHCIFTHHPHPLGETHPYTDFTLDGLGQDWDSGGCQAQISLRDVASEADIGDGAFAVLWKENRWNERAEVTNIVYTDDNYLFVGGNIGYTSTGNGFDISFEAAVFHGEEVVADGWPFNLTIDFDGDLQFAAPMVQDGKISFTASYVGPEPLMEVVVYYDIDTPLATATYKRGRTQALVPALATRLVAFPQSVFTGYVRRGYMEKRNDPGEGTQLLTLEMVSIEGLLANEFQFSVPVTATENPAAWEEYATWLTTGRAAHYFFKWHSTLMEVANVYGLVDVPLPDAAVDFEPGTIYEMADNATYQAGIRCHFVADRQGGLHLTPDVNLLRDSERAALPIVAEITDADRGSEWGVQREPWPQTAIARASGIAWDGVTFEDVAVTGDITLRAGIGEAHCALAPGENPSRGGPDYALLDNQILENQAHANELAGRLLARDNSPYPELAVTFAGDYLDVLDAARAEFWQTEITVDDWLLPFGLGTINLILRRVEAEYDSGFMRVSASFEMEADGPPGIEAGCPELPEEFDWGEGDYDIEPLPSPQQSPGGTGLGTAHRMTDTVLGRTSDLSAASPSWSQIATAVDLGVATLYDFILHPRYPSNAAFLLTSAGVFRTYNIQSATPTWTNILTVAQMEASLPGYTTFTPAMKIAGSINVEGYFGTAFTVSKDGAVNNERRLRYAYTYDSGESWNFSNVFTKTSGGPNPDAWLRYVGALDILMHMPTAQPTIVIGRIGNNHRSDDGGVTWYTLASSGSGLGGHNRVLGISFPYTNNEDGNVLYMVVSCVGTGCGTLGIYKSTNGGATFTRIKDHGWVTNVSFRDIINIHIFDEKKISFVGNGSRAIIYYTEDGGVTFTTIDSFGPQGDPFGAGGFPYNDELFYLSTENGIYISQDGWGSLQDKTGNWSWGHTGIRHVLVPNWTE